MLNNQKRKERDKELVSLSNHLGFRFKDLKLLNIALTHGSYIKESNRKELVDNQRLEFFGDAVLKLFVSDYLMKRYPSYSEGQLSNLRAVVVSEKVLANVAEKLNLQKYLLLGKNEKKSLPVSVLADAVEALLAVIYYQCGLKNTQEFILEYWLEYIEMADKSKEKDNYKAVLQEYTQGSKLGLPAYKTLSEVGPDHNKEFEVGVFLNNNELARGKGKTKKDGSQDAAKNALIILGKIQNNKSNNVKNIKTK